MHLDEEFDGEEFEDDEVFDDDFLQLLPSDARLLYESLIHAIKTNSGIGFHDHNQGHLIAGGAVQINDVTLGPKLVVIRPVTEGCRGEAKSQRPCRSQKLHQR